MIFSFISYLWKEWNIRAFIILSLSLQILVFLFAPFRKKTANGCIVSLLLLAYMMADLVAVFEIGLISYNQGNSCTRATEVDRALQAFWASFLLLHLGGPDTITDFSLEDSSFWRRHLLSLIFQVVATIYVFIQIFPNDKLLMIPTILVFLAAVIKNAERTLALNLSSLQAFKKSMLQMPDSDKGIMFWDDTNKCLVKELESLRYSSSYEEEAKLPEPIVVKHAYSFFQIFKVIIGDLMFTQEQRKMSRTYFFKVSAIDALRIISVELNFIYEVLHTKALVIRSKWSYIFRFIAFTNVVIAFILFNRLKKHRFPKLDVEITYTLLFGGIGLDVIALFMLVFSDWTIVDANRHSFLHKLVSTTCSLRKPRFTTYEVERNANITYAVLDTRLIFRRWSESISACNLLSMFLKESPRKMSKYNRYWDIIASSIVWRFSFQMAETIISCFHQAVETITKGCGLRIKTLKIANTRFVSKNPFINELWVFVFEEVRRKSRHAETLEVVRSIFEARGDWFLNHDPRNHCRILLPYVTGANFDSSILMWHIATELWYNKEKPFADKNDKREFSKILSDYMLYLLLNRSNVVSAVAGIAQVTSTYALLMLQLFFNHAPKDMEELCKRVIEIEYPDKGNLFFVGIELAKKMESLGEMKWEVMSGVWVEMLSYAAVHIKGEAHVQVLSKGGELLTFVWLLMVHFGCFYKPEWGMTFLG